MKISSEKEKMIKDQTFQLFLIVLFITIPSIIRATLQMELVNLQRDLQNLEKYLKESKHKKIPQIKSIKGSNVMSIGAPLILKKVLQPIYILGFTEKIHQVIAQANGIINDIDKSGRNELQKANGVLREAIKWLENEFKISLKELNEKIIEAIVYINGLSQEDRDIVKGKINNIYAEFNDNMIRILKEFYNYLKEVEKYGKDLKKNEFAHSTIPFVGDKEEYKKFKVAYKELYKNFERLTQHIKNLNEGTHVQK